MASFLFSYYRKNQDFSAYQFGANSNCVLLNAALGAL